MTFWETVQGGEYVMIALAVLFITCICVWAANSTRLGSYNKKYPDFMHRLRDLVVEGDIDNARQLCETSVTPGARVLGTGLKLMGKPMTDLTSAMQDVAALEKESMNSGLGWLKAMAVISPLLGLGGSLVGVIDHLRNLAEINAPIEINTLCGAIAPTIVTTVAGLGVGIFAIVAYSCLESRIDSSRLRISQLTIEFTDLLNEPS